MVQNADAAADPGAFAVDIVERKAVAEHLAIRVGTTGNDFLSMDADTLAFGLQGDDSILLSPIPPGADAEQWAVGGSGDDHYNLGPFLAIILEAGSSPNDRLSSGRGDPARGDDDFYQIDGRHLAVIPDTDNGGDGFIILDWQEANNRIEQFSLGSAAYSFSDFRQAVLASPRYMGTMSWEDFGLSGQEADEIRAQIDALYSVGRLAEDYAAGVSPPVTFFGPDDIDSADDGAAMFREVASDDAIAIAREISHERGFNSTEGGTVFTGRSVRDLFYLDDDLRTVTRVEGGGGDDVYVVRYVPGVLTGGDPRIIEGENAGNDTVWVSVSDYILPNGVENLVSMTENGVRMLANDGNNKFIGGPGDDQLFSGFGEDIVYGREGNDLIVGGDEADALFGAAGNDTFAWELSHVGDDDRIWDWNTGDRLDLRGLGGVMLTQTGADTQVWYDPNRDGVAEAHIVTVVGVVDRDLIEAAITL